MIWAWGGIPGHTHHQHAQVMARTPLSLLPTNPTTMAVRSQSHCIASVGSDMAAYSRWSAWLDRWMSHPAFDMDEFNRLCRVYQLD